MNITVHTFVSLDGVMQGPGAPEEDTSDGFTRGGWMVPLAGGDFGEVVDGWFARGESLLLGRRTFELMRGYWPHVTDPEDAVAAALNGRHKYVVSSTLTDPGWGESTVIALQQVRDLKERSGGELQVHGSWQLVQALHGAGLVDSYRILQFPVVVGQGKLLFSHPGEAATLEVTHAATLPGGIVALEADVTAVGTIGTGAYVPPVDSTGVQS